MNAEIPAQAVVAVATVAASLITGMIAMVNLTLGKEQKVSEFRQAWIDGLRDDLSKFFSSLRFLVEATQAASLHTREVAGEIFPHTAQQLAELRVVVAETLSRIELRLNPDEPEHIELLRLLKAAHGQCHAGYAASESTVAALSALEVAAEYARPVLKSEWTRVKRGEPVFRYLRIWLIPAVLVISLGLGAFIAFAKFQ